MTRSLHRIFRRCNNYRMKIESLNHNWISLPLWRFRSIKDFAQPLNYPWLLVNEHWMVVNDYRNNLLFLTSPIHFQISLNHIIFLWEKLWFRLLIYISITSITLKGCNENPDFFNHSVLQFNNHRMPRTGSSYERIQGTQDYR